MPDDSPPTFSTFDEAWNWFMDGGALIPVDEQREGFLHGRAQFLAFQVPIGEMAVAGAIETWQDDLASIEGLSLVPPELLHITMRGVGFQVIANPQPGDVLRQDIGAISERAARSLRGMEPIAITLGPMNVFPDALVLQVQPIEPMRHLVRALDAIRQPDAFPYHADNYLPHVTIASFLDTGVARPLREHLPSYRGMTPLSSTVDRIHLARWWFTGHDIAATPELDTVRAYKLP